MTALITGLLAAALSPVSSAEPLPAATQNALVQKHCAVCHSDAASNGGLSLQHYDAAQPNPPLAAMLLSKLRNGAIDGQPSGT